MHAVLESNRNGPLIHRLGSRYFQVGTQTLREPTLEMSGASSPEHGPQDDDASSGSPASGDGRSSASTTWVFGYGSLIWKPDFRYLERRVGYVDGWVRRFYQGSTDHRGVPGAPGRVVTLIPADHAHAQEDEVGGGALEGKAGTPAPGAAGEAGEGGEGKGPTSNSTSRRTYGMCYKLDPTDVAAVFAYLTHREKCGYACETLLVRFASGGDVDGAGGDVGEDNRAALGRSLRSSSSRISDGNSAGAGATKESDVGEESVRAICWMATPDNDEYLGPAALDAMAAQIARSVGPSGPNSEYLFGLERALLALGLPVDAHVDALANRVRGRMGGAGVIRDGPAGAAEPGGEAGGVP